MTGTELFRYYGKRVTVTFLDGDTLDGFVAVFTRAIDNDPEEASISLETTSYSDGLIEIMLSEIKRIEVVKTVTE